MVDLSTVKMPVVEYEGGHQLPVNNFAEDETVNWWYVNGQAYHKDGTPVDAINTRITAIHPAAEPADGWVSFNGAFVRDYGESTVCIEDTEIGFQVRTLGGEQPFEWDIGMCKTVEECCAALDAAYAAHVAAKLVLAWDDDEHCSRSHHDNVTYLVTSTRTTAIKFWFAHMVNHRAEVVPLFGGERYTERDEAKAACERHARWE